MPVVKTDLQKLENLLKSATNARQRKMYESLLAKARTKYQKVEAAPQPEKEPVPEIKPEAKVTSPAKSKQKKQTIKQVKEQTIKEKKQKTKQVKEEEITVLTSPAPTEQPKNKQTKAKQKTQKEEATIFQATGLITCTPKIQDDNLYITVDGQDYELRRGQYKAKRSFNKLKEEIIENGSKEVRLIVYPKIAHNLAEDKIEYWFSLVKELPDNSLKQEGFILRGIWQHVTHCVKPVISIYRNFEMLEHYKRASAGAAKKAFARPQDFPVVWSAPIEPFQYNSKLKKDKQMPRYFVQVRATFKDGQFHFTEAIEEPTLDIPKYISPTRKHIKRQPKKQATEIL